MSTWQFFALGAVTGAAAVAVLTVKAMPKLMLRTRRSRLGFDETVAAIEAAIPEHGWSSPATIDLNASLAKQEIAFGPRVKLVQMCKAPYARDVLKDNRDVSAMMPCAVSVWEDDQGNVNITKLNTGLMGRLFGGTVARVMGGSVAREEKAMLARVTGD